MKAIVPSLSQSFILTCEHGGNTVPEDYSYIFFGEEEVLYSHKAIDHGALRLAKYIASKLELPLYYTTITRLLVEANRSPDDEELFSEFTENESEKVKEDILEKHYKPHRKRIEDKITEFIQEGHRVIHIALHTFAPVVEGEVRDTDIGILFDPTRTKELDFANDFKKEIHDLNQERRVHLNLPYKGTEDCLPNFLRAKYPQDQYLGFEFEINQRFYLTGEANIWETLLEELTTALKVLKFRTPNH